MAHLQLAGQAVSLLLLHKQIFPRDCHQISSMSVMVDHVVLRVLSISFLNLSPPVCSILHPAIQIGISRPALHCPPKRLQKVIVDVYFICQGYKIRLLRLDSPQEIMEYFIVFQHETN
jgi:hypothetical protein